MADAAGSSGPPPAVDSPADDVDVDSLIGGLATPLFTRDEMGKFSGDTRRHRKRQPPSFPVLEVSGNEIAPDSSHAAAVPCRTWLIRGPVRGWSDDGWRLSTITTVRARAAMKGPEVYVRSMEWLVPGTYVDVEDFLPSVRFVAVAAVAANETWDTASPSSSFRGLQEGQHLEDDDIKKVIRNATTSLREGTKRVQDGYVALVCREPARRDPVNRAAVCALLRQRSSRAVADFRRKGTATMRTRWRKLLRGMGPTVVAQVRRALELQEPDHGTDGIRARASRIRLSWGSTQMQLLPTRAQLRAERRRAFDADDRIAHFFFTREGYGDLLRWDYVRGSGSAGIRRYRSANGDEKRLRGYNDRYWQQRTVGADGDDSDDVSADEDDGFFFANDNVETEGCYAPQEQDPEKVKELVAHSHSYLENDDSTGELRILGIGFDAVAALQRAIDLSVLPNLTEEQAAAPCPAVVTFAADGGTVKGKMLTAFTAAVSWRYLRYGRTDLTPLVYALAGEKQVDKQLAGTVRGMLQEVVGAMFTAKIGAVDTAGNVGGDGSSVDMSDTELQNRTQLQVHDVVEVCGMCISHGTWCAHGNPAAADFSMSQWIHGLTGSSDHGRCAQNSGCKVPEYNRPSCYLEGGEDRCTEVVSQQWELSIMVFATWAVTRSINCHIAFQDGEAFVPCTDCDNLLSLADGDALISGILHCHSGLCAGAPVYVLHDISKSAFNDALNAARALCGGVRGYPLLRGMRSRLQLPVLHCTGNLAKVLNNFALACLPESVREQARTTLLAISGKGQMNALYLREHRELVAHAAVHPGIFSDDLDIVFVVLFQLVQLLNAAWRASLSDADSASRDGAASISRLAASILGPLFQEVKPLDPVTKDAKVFSLYLHAPVAHLWHQVGSNRQDVAYVSDEAIEGHLRGVGRYSHNHGNNASQAALLSDLASVCDATIKFSTPRSHPSSLVFTKYVRVCACWKTLGTRGPADFAALQTIAGKDPLVDVDVRANGEELFFTLPLHNRVDENSAIRGDSSGNRLTGKKESLRRGLRRRQAVINACFCGRLTNTPASPLMGVAQGRRNAARARREAASSRTSCGASASAAGAGPDPMSGAETSAASVSDAGDGVRSGGSAEEGMPATHPLVPAPSSTARRAKRSSAATLVRQSVPPLWLLRMCFSKTSAYTTVRDVAPDGVEEPSPVAVDAALRQNVSVLQILLMRTRTVQFARWAAEAKVDVGDMVEAAKSLIDRLTTLRMARLSDVVGEAAMEI